MTKGLLWIGRAIGALGAFVTLMAFAVRASGQFFLANLQVGTMLQAGIAAMILGCLCLLTVLTTAPINRQ